MRPLSILLIALALPFNAYGQLHATRYLGPVKPGPLPSEMRAPTPLYAGRTLAYPASLDSFFTKFAATYGIPGIAACIIKDHRVVWKGYYGYADVGRKIPVSDSTEFFMASISKTFVVTALMQLYEAGRFGLDESVNGYLPFSVKNPNFPNEPITFRMLLTHTSSIQDNWNVIPTVSGDDTTSLGSFLREYLTPSGKYYSASLNYYGSQPGLKWNYSNVGATLGAYLVEILSGVPFDKYCRDSIFTPLKMTHTGWHLKDLDTNLIARPYTNESGALVDNGLFGIPIYPAGQLRTTLPSLARFLLANMGGGELDGSRVLDSTTVRLIRTRSYSWDPYAGQGLIWWNERVLGRQCWDHKGGFTGAITSMYMCEENGSGTIWFTNYSSDTVPWQAIDEHLMATADTLFGMPDHPTFDKGILLVNGVDFATYGNEIVSAYRDTIFTGGYPISFWDCFQNTPTGGYPSPLPSPVGRGAISLQALGDYSTVIWLGNDYNGDWYSWDASPIVSYLFLGGNVILLTKNGSDLVNSVMSDNLGMAWAELGQALTSTTATYAGLTALRPLGSQTQNDLFSITLMNSESKLLYTATGSFSGERGIGVWRKPASGGLSRKSGGNLVYIAGRPYRWNHADLRSSMRFILQNLVGEVVSVREKPATGTPMSFGLDQNYPNPFNGISNIGFRISTSAKVKLQVFDLLGREIALLVDEPKAAGTYEVRYDVADLPSGVYLYRLTAGSLVQTRKMTLVK